MSEIRVDKIINEVGTGPVELTQGATLPIGKSISGSGDLNISGVSTFQNNIIQTSGLVGIGTDNPLQRFQIGTANTLGVSTDGKVFVVTSNADVGIGTTNPTSKLHVVGNTNIIGTLELGHASDTSLTRVSAGVVAIEGVNIVTTSSTDTLTNKTLTSPTLTTPVLGTPSSGTLTSCTGLPISGLTSSTSTALGIGSIELGHASDTSLTRVSAGVVAIEGVNIVTTSSTDTLTNKTLTSPTLTTPVLGTPSSGTLTSCTGLPLTTGVTGTLPVANGGTGVTASTGTGSVVLSASPTFTGTVVAAAITATGDISAANFNSTSDISLKDNIQTIVNPLDKIIKLNGVTFNWKENQKPSIGVIAQELEKVLPELVTQGEVKSVNYNGIIGVLIEAIKELKKEIEDLKETK